MTGKNPGRERSGFEKLRLLGGFVTGAVVDRGPRQPPESHGD
jgi:hypothetical protein